MSTFSLILLNHLYHMPAMNAGSNTHTHLTALCLGPPGWTGTRKVKPILDFTEARDGEWQWHQLGHMQVCTLLRTDNHASTPSLIFYRPDALPATQPTASKHCMVGNTLCKYQSFCYTNICKHHFLNPPIDITSLYTGWLPPPPIWDLLAKSRCK